MEINIGNQGNNQCWSRKKKNNIYTHIMWCGVDCYIFDRQCAKGYNTTSCIISLLFSEFE